MLPLPNAPWPATPLELQQQLCDCLRAGSIDDAAHRVTVSGDWPALDALRLDLNGVRLKTWPRPHSPHTPLTERSRGPSCREFQLQAAPLHLAEIAHPHFHLRASELTLEFARDSDGRHWLLLSRLRTGVLEVRIAQSELDQLALDNARRLATSHGINVDEVNCGLHSAGPNAIGLGAELAASKSFLRGRVRLRGTCRLESSQLILHDLKCEGLGAVGAVASRTVQAMLDRFEGHSIRPAGPFLTGLEWDRIELVQTDPGWVHVRVYLRSTGAGC